jgi:hypothetical protein
VSEMSDWIQSNWFELGSLLVQCAILATLASYGRKTMRILGDSQSQDETLERLSPSSATAERLTIRQTVTPSSLEGAEHGVVGTAAVSHNLMSWLQAPMASRGVDPSNKVVRWLQAPM